MNLGGCLALVQGNDICGRAVNAHEQCDAAACASCKLNADASLQDLEACTAQADARVCAGYVQPAECADQAAEAGSGAPCFAGPDFVTSYNAIAALFCLAP
jgi:hypothetical protein